MSISRSNSLSSSRDSDGPCLVISPLAGSFEQNRTPPLSLSELDLLISSFTETHIHTPLFPSTLITEIDPASASYAAWFKTINDQTPEHRYPHNVAARFENRVKCRYPDVFPADHNLVTLQTTGGFIHANEFENTILTQGPLERTVIDFWLLLFEKKITATACLAAHLEPSGDGSGRLTEKTYPYWDRSLQLDWEMPPEQLLIDTTINEKVFQVHRLSRDEAIITKEGSEQLVIKRTFRIIFGDEEHITHQLHYIGWPDFSTCNPSMLLELILHLEGQKIVCHCSAGLGRTGVVAMVLAIINNYRTTGKIPTVEDVCTLLITLRESRPGAIKTASQLGLIFKTLHLFFISQLEGQA